MTSAMGSGESGRGRTTKATDERDNNDSTIVGRNGFVRRLKQQSTNKGGTRGEMVMTELGDDD